MINISILLTYSRPFTHNKIEKCLMNVYELSLLLFFYRTHLYYYQPHIYRMILRVPFQEDGLNNTFAAFISKIAIEIGRDKLVRITSRNTNRLVAFLRPLGYVQVNNSFYTFFVNKR